MHSQKTLTNRFISNTRKTNKNAERKRNWYTAMKAINYSLAVSCLFHLETLALDLHFSFVIFSFFCSLAISRLVQMNYEQAEGWLNLFIVTTLYQQQPCSLYIICLTILSLSFCWELLCISTNIWVLYPWTPVKINICNSSDFTCSISILGVNHFKSSSLNSFQFSFFYIINEIQWVLTRMHQVGVSSFQFNVVFVSYLKWISFLFNNLRINNI